MKNICVLLFCVLFVLTGCSAGDKANLIEWMQNMDPELTVALFWSQPTSENSSNKTELTTDEEKKLLYILNHLNTEDITWNKHLAGITPEYGFHLIISDDEYYINQAEAPQGQTEISFNGKQWWIKSNNLDEFMKSFLNVS